MYIIYIYISLSPVLSTNNDLSKAWYILIASPVIKHGDQRTWRCLGPSTASAQQAGRPSDQGQAAGVEIRQGRHGDGGDADGSGEQRIPWVEETVAIWGFQKKGDPQNNRRLVTLVMLCNV